MGRLPFVASKAYRNDAGGCLPSDVGDVFHTEHPLPELWTKDYTALVFIEEVLDTDEPNARSLGRLGKSIPTPTGFVGVTKRYTVR